MNNKINLLNDLSTKRIQYFLSKWVGINDQKLIGKI